MGSLIRFPVERRREPDPEPIPFERDWTANPQLFYFTQVTWNTTISTSGFLDQWRASLPTHQRVWYDLRARLRRSASACRRRR